MPQGSRGLGAVNRRVVLLCGLAPALLTVAIALYRPPILAQLDLRVYDAMLRSAPAKPRADRVAIVDIDERSLAAFGQWPWRRDLVGRLISRIRANGASIIATDIVFAEPDRADVSSPVRNSDAALASVMAEGHAILGYAFTFDQSAPSADACVLHPLNVPIVQAAGDAETPLFHATGVVCSLPALATAAGASGFLNAVPDAVGVLRRTPLAIEYKGQIYPSLALAAVTAATRAHPIALKAANVNSASLALDGQTVPLDGRSNLLLRYRGGNRTFPHVPAADVLNGAIAANAFKNAIVFVGSTALGAREVVSTPFDRLFTGVEVQATAADNLLMQDFLARPEHALTLEAFVVLIAGIGITLLIARVGLALGTASGAASLLMLWWGARWLLAERGEYLSPLFPAVGLVASLAAATIARLVQERGRADQASLDSATTERLMIQSLLSLTEMRDAETGRHSRRTRQYARLLAERLAIDPVFAEYLTPDRIDLLASLAPLHDIGKVGVPDQLLNKPAALTADEYREMKKHPIYGLDVIMRAEKEAGAQNNIILAMAKDIVYTHHERWDGQGYPRGLKREQIPIPGRLMALVDVYDALTTRRVYRQPMTHDKAVALILDGKGTHFDPTVVNAFMQIAPAMRAINETPSAQPVWESAIENRAMTT
jgi:adenylate cyclase